MIEENKKGFENQLKKRKGPFAQRTEEKKTASQIIRGPRPRA